MEMVSDERAALARLLPGHVAHGSRVHRSVVGQRWWPGPGWFREPVCGLLDTADMVKGARRAADSVDGNCRHIR